MIGNTQRWVERGGPAKAPEQALVKSVEKLLMHWRQGDLHPVDYQRLWYALKWYKEEKPKGKEYVTFDFDNHKTDTMVDKIG